MVSSFALGPTHLIVFAHIHLTPLITNIQSDCVATGISNVLGNKGGVAISFNIGKTSLICISSHLAAGHNHVERRNEDWKKIYNALILKNKDYKGSETKGNAVGAEVPLE